MVLLALTLLAGVPKCEKRWNEAAADSVWFCPDPRPPAPPTHIEVDTIPWHWDVLGRKVEEK